MVKGFAHSWESILTPSRPGQPGKKEQSSDGMGDAGTLQEEPGKGQLYGQRPQRAHRGERHALCFGGHAAPPGENCLPREPEVHPALPTEHVGESSL